MSKISPKEAVPDDFAAQLKPYLVRRKRLATFCLFFVITAIILGLQVFGTFDPILTIALIAAGALFVWKASRTLVHFGWI